MSLYPSHLIQRFFRANGKEDIAQYAQHGCLNPVKINFIDSMGAASTMYVPCGHCISCQDERRNQLAARMFLHDKYANSPWQHVYYITLTYGSYNLNLYKEHPFKSDWLDTFPVLTTVNYGHRPAWSPVVLRQEHIVKFIKRLRQQNPLNTFSYVYCGEYGEDFYRPHFHLILWSTKPLTASVVRHAWSYKGVRTSDRFVIKPYRGQVCSADRLVYCPIGHIKFVDLVANGSTAYKVRSDSPNNAMHNFSYVAKYLAKPFSIGSPLLEARLQDAYNSIRLADMTSEDENPDFLNNKILYSNVSYEKFKQIVAPFTCYSRSYSIGKGYALENLTRFEQGNYDLPTFRGVRLSFPSYFLEVLNRKRFPLRFQKTTASGYSFTKSNLPSVRAFFLAFRDNKAVVHSLSPGSTFNSIAGYGDVYKIFDQLSVDFSARSSYFFQRFLDSIVWKTEDSTFYFRYSFHFDYFEQVFYDRSKRDYIPVGYISRESFCDMVLDQIDEYQKRYDANQYQLQQSVAFFDIMSDKANEPAVLDVRLKRISERENHQRKYNAGHLTDKQ